MANEGRYGGALLEKIEPKDAGRQGRVSHVQADTDRGVVHRRDLLCKL